MAAPGRLLASGRAADVFELPGDRVVRRNREGQVAELEAAVMEHARARGFPTPIVHSARGPDLEMERVHGPTMLDDLAARPWRLRRHARLLAALHSRLHAIPASPGLSGPGWAGGDLGGALLHLDLHPDNVILGRQGPVVIDWSNAARGAGAADVALSWVILATSEIPARGPATPLLVGFRRLFVRAFLARTDRAQAGAWLPAAAGFRLADPHLLASERPAVQALAHRGDPSA
jgi:aminoglycoside phosphotransferase (APT) family kinase protein